MEKVFVVIPNWNGKDQLNTCLKSVFAQSQKCRIVVVENGSTDGSLEYLRSNYPDVELVVNQKNLGFAGGVNSGIRYSISEGAEYIALLNNDATIEKDWLKHLCESLDQRSELGAVTGKLLNSTGENIDSTGDLYTTWGLPLARQRDLPAHDAMDKPEDVFGACAGASLYRVRALQEVGFFDDGFFAYYEDSDLSFRLQLAGWKILYNPKAVGYHATGSTSSKIKGFTTYQTTKNLPMLFFKDVPWRLVPYMLPRFFVSYYAIMASSLFKGRAWPALKGHFVWLLRSPSIFVKRHRIQKSRKVGIEYIKSILLDDLPPNAFKLRRLRAFFTRKP